jgi:N-methylhydantoinase A
MRRVLVPANPGILCAMGLLLTDLLTDLRADFAVTRLLSAKEEAAAELAEGFAALAAQAERWFEQEGIAPADRRLTRTVDMRYHGQNYELGIALPDGATMTMLATLFAEAHRQRYGFATDEDPVEIVTLRLEANGVVRKAELETHPEAGPDASAAIAHHRDVWLAETRGVVSTPIYARGRLRPGNRFAGPAIVEQMDATTLVPPGMTVRVDRWLNLILEAA